MLYYVVFVAEILVLFIIRFRVFRLETFSGYLLFVWRCFRCEFVVVSSVKVFFYGRVVRRGGDSSKLVYALRAIGIDRSEEDLEESKGVGAGGERAMRF